MEHSDTATTTATISSISPTSPPPPAVVLSPCAACKILRRRCADKCVLAPYFPPNDPHKFTTAHRVFGASNMIKFLQELPVHQRSDAVSSMVYEANARLRDPVYGCAGVICHLQKQVTELQAQLAIAQAEILNLQNQQNNLMTIICMEMEMSTPNNNESPRESSSDDEFMMISTNPHHEFQDYNFNFFNDNNAPASLWEEETLY